jgi:hypothetical protein
MSTNIDEQLLEVDNLSRGIQRATTKFQKADGDVYMAINGSFEVIGGVEKVKGSDRIGTDISTTSTSTSTSSTTSTSTSTSSSTSSSTSTSSTTTGA